MRTFSSLPARFCAQPAVRNAIHKKQSSCIFHYLCEWRSRSPVEENKMTARTASLMETSDTGRRQRRDRSPVMSCSPVDYINKPAMAEQRQTHVTSLGLTGYNSCCTNLSYILKILCHRWPFTDRNNQVVFFTFGFGWHFLVSVR